MSNAINTAYETAKHLGLGLVLWQILSAMVTGFFRDRTPDELAAMKKGQPKMFRFLELCKAAGINSPRLWQLVMGILFARVASMADEHHGDPPIEPPAPEA